MGAVFRSGLRVEGRQDDGKKVVSNQRHGNLWRQVGQDEEITQAESAARQRPSMWAAQAIREVNQDGGATEECRELRRRGSIPRSQAAFRTSLGIASQEPPRHSPDTATAFQFAESQFSRPVNCFQLIGQLTRLWQFTVSHMLTLLM